MQLIFLNTLLKFRIVMLVEKIKVYISWMECRYQYGIFCTGNFRINIFRRAPGNVRCNNFNIVSHICYYINYLRLLFILYNYFQWVIGFIYFIYIVVYYLTRGSIGHSSLMKFAVIHQVSCDHYRNLNTILYLWL